MTDMEIDLKEGLAVKEEIIKMLANATGQKPDKVREDMERDHWLTPKEAKDYGLIDKVL